MASLLRVLLSVGKKMTTVNWLKPQSPSIIQCREKLKNIYVMEKITARLWMRMDQFDNKWT